MLFQVFIIIIVGLGGVRGVLYSITVVWFEPRSISCLLCVIIRVRVEDSSLEPLRWLKRQSPTTVFLKTTLSWTITQDKQVQSCTAPCMV